MSVYSKAAAIAFNLSCPEPLVLQKFTGCGLVNGRMQDGTPEPAISIRGHIFNREVGISDGARGLDFEANDVFILNTTSDLETTFGCNFDLIDTANPDNCPVHIINQAGEKFVIKRRMVMPKAQNCLFWYALQGECIIC